MMNWSKKVKTLIVLTGPKGSGKSFIGRLLEKNFDVSFLYVEAIHKKAIESKKNITESFGLVENEIHEKFKTCEILIIETTGASPYTKTFLENLGQNYKLKFVKISVPLELCLERIKFRNKAEHIEVPEEITRKVFEIFESLDWDFDLEIRNEDLLEEEIVESFRVFLKEIANE